jgi:hypothetical protein
MLCVCFANVNLMLIAVKNGRFLRFRPFPDKEVVKGQKKEADFL